MDGHQVIRTTEKFVATVLGMVLVLGMTAGLQACGTTDVGADGSMTRGMDLGGVRRDEAIARMVPREVSEDGVLTVGSNTTYPPAEFVAEDGRTAVGYELDLMRAVAAVFGLKERTVYTPFDSIIPSTGYRFDVAASGVTITDERRPAVDFVTDFNAGSSYVVKSGNAAHLDSSDVCGHTIAGQLGTLQEQNLNDMSAACKAKGRPALRVQSVKMQTDATTAVLTGKADAFYADTPVAGYAIKQTGTKLQGVGKPIGVVPEAVAVRKGDMAMARAMRAAIDKLIADGTYMSILNHWGVSDGAIRQSCINPPTKKNE